MDDLLDKVQKFITANLGSSICLCSNDEVLLYWTCSRIAEKITEEYMILDEPGIDDVRYMTEFLYSATGDGYKVVFIHKTERILQEAANSMLKILEEPPRYSVIVLTTTRFVDLLPTIRSRVKTMNLTVGKNILDSLRGKLKDHPKIDLIMEFCCTRFDVLSYILQVEGFSEAIQFDESEFTSIFAEKELSAQNKLKALLMLDDLYTRFPALSQRDLVQLYMNIMEKSNKIDLTALVVFTCGVFQTILELKGYREVSTFKWLDSIISNRYMNFNAPLTLLNLLILIRKSAKR